MPVEREAAKARPGVAQKVIRVLSPGRMKLVKIYVQKYSVKQPTDAKEEKQRFEDELLEFDRDFRAALAYRQKQAGNSRKGQAKRNKSSFTVEDDGMISVKQADGTFQDQDLQIFISDVTHRLNSIDINAKEDDIVLRGQNAEDILSVLSKKLSEYTIKSGEDDAQSESTAAFRIQKNSKGSKDQASKTKVSQKQPAEVHATRAAKRKTRKRQNSRVQDAIYANIDRLERPIQGFEADQRPEHDMPVDQKLRKSGEWPSGRMERKKDIDQIVEKRP